MRGNTAPTKAKQRQAVPPPQPWRDAVERWRKRLAALPWRRWAEWMNWREYLLALPFCIGVLVVPCLPTVAVLFLVQSGAAPLAGFLVLLFLTFGFPIVRVKRPRVAWWIGAAVAVGSLPSAMLLIVMVATFSVRFAVAIWLLMIPLAVLNWRKLRPWTFATYAVAILAQFVAMGEVGLVVQAAIVMGLMSLFFLLRDRDNISRAPIIMTFAMGLLLARMTYFYFDVGGDAQVKHHPAARQVFEFTSQHSGWGKMLGPNPRFLTPSCNGEQFFIGANVGWQSGLVKMDPATNLHLVEPLVGGVPANMAQDCLTRSVFVGAVGNETALALSEYDPRHELARERIEGAKIEMLRLDRTLNRLYVSAANRPWLFVLRASNLAEMGRAPFSAPVTDIVIDRQGGHDVLVATSVGEIARLRAHDAGKVASVNAGFSQYLCKLALDEKHRRLFVASSLGYSLNVFDADSLAFIASAPQPRGNHYMQYDAKRDLLYVGNYLYGTVRAFSFDGKKLTQAWSVGVGKRVQYLTLDHLRDQLCFTSSVGGYCLALEALQPAPVEATPAPTEAGGEAADEAASDEGAT